MMTTDLAVRENNGHLEVWVLSSLTIMNAAAVRTAVLSVWEQHGKPQPLILDLAAANPIDSSGMGELLEISRRTEAAGARLVLRGLGRVPRRMLDRTGLGMLFQIAEAGPPTARDLTCPYRS